MKIENTKAQMRRGILEFCTLAIISREEMYPSDILRAMKEAKLIVVEGTLYPLLTRLKNAEILDYRWEESKSGPPRKYYRLTDKGLVFLEDLRATWKQLADAVAITTTDSTIKTTITTNQKTEQEDE